MSTVIVEGKIGGPMSVTGTGETINGLTNGSTNVWSNAFDDLRVFIIRGLFQMPAIPGAGDFYTKFEVDNYITFSTPLVDGENIYIKTIR